MALFSRKSVVRGVIDSRGIPHAIDFEGLKSAVEEYRGTRIEIVESQELNGPRICGVWTGDGQVDTIAVPRDARPEMKFFIACHEFGHMLDEPVQIEQSAGVDPDLESYLASVINPDRRVAYAFARGSHSDERERRAEAIGDQLATRIFRAQRQDAPRDYNFDRVFG